MRILHHYLGRSRADICATPDEPTTARLTDAALSHLAAAAADTSDLGERASLNAAHAWCSGAGRDDAENAVRYGLDLVLRGL